METGVVGADGGGHEYGREQAEEADGANHRQGDGNRHLRAGGGIADGGLGQASQHALAVRVDNADDLQRWIAGLKNRSGDRSRR